MSANFDKSIVRAIDFASNAGLLLQCGPAHSLNASIEFKKISRQAQSYHQIYDSGVKNQDFNLMLNDYSFFQFTETIEHSELRLAYYPNPHSFIEYKNDRRTAEEMLHKGEITLQELEQLISEGNLTFDIPIIRYDLSEEQYCSIHHPAAHFHIGFRAENRWPVNRILSPFAFFLKILFLYYPSIWKEKGDYVNSQSTGNYYEDEYIRELSLCPRLNPDKFKKTESLRLHFH